MSPKENNLIDRGCTLLLTETIPLRSPTGNNLVSTLALAEPISPRKRSWTKNDLIENGNDSLLIRLRNSATSYSKYSGYYPGFNYKITHIPIYLRRLLADLSISGIDDFRLTVGKFNQLLKLLAWIYKINSPPPQIEDKIWTVFSNQLRFVLPKAVCRPSFPGFFISLESVLYSAAFQITQNRDLDQVYHNVMVYTFDPIISCLSAIDMSACFNILKSFLECIQNIIIFLLLRKNRLWYSHNAMEDPDTRTELLELVKGKELNHSSTSCLVDHLKIIESIQIGGKYSMKGKEFTEYLTNIHPKVQLKLISFYLLAIDLLLTRLMALRERHQWVMSENEEDFLTKTRLSLISFLIILDDTELLLAYLKINW